MPAPATFALSQSTNGRPITVNTNPGSIIHVTPAGTSSWDSISIQASNPGTGSAKLLVLYVVSVVGATTTVLETIAYVHIPNETLGLPILSNYLLQNGLRIYAQVDSGSGGSIELYGSVTRFDA